MKTFRQDTKLRVAVTAVLVGLLSAASLGRADEVELREKTVVRRGAVIGLDPGIVFRVEGEDEPVYLRLDLRLAACLKPWLQLGGDLRADLLSTVTKGAAQRRHEFGPSMALFPVRGLFNRVFVHLADFDPVSLTAGGQLGYEFSCDKFSAIGFALGADAEMPVNGDSLRAYSFHVSLYFSAYDLTRRRGRDSGGV